jgi:predicted ArsR family transcriptional regulator
MENVNIATQSTRSKILYMLSRQTNYATRLAQDLEMERKTTHWHLKQLETAGLIKGEYVLSDNRVPVSIKQYKLTSKGREILAHLK